MPTIMYINSLPPTADWCFEAQTWHTSCDWACAMVLASENDFAKVQDQSMMYNGLCFSGLSAVLRVVASVDLMAVGAA